MCQQVRTDAGLCILNENLIYNYPYELAQLGQTNSLAFLLHCPRHTRTNTKWKLCRLMPLSWRYEIMSPYKHPLQNTRYADLCAQIILCDLHMCARTFTLTHAWLSSQVINNAQTYSRTSSRERESSREHNVDVSTHKRMARCVKCAWCLLITDYMKIYQTRNKTHGNYSQLAYAML